jgi:hypothetical protein
MKVHVAQFSVGTMAIGKFFSTKSKAACRHAVMFIRGCTVSGAETFRLLRGKMEKE